MDNVVASTNSPVVTPPEITLVPNNSLLTETPEAGRQLAVKMARLIIKLTQRRSIAVRVLRGSAYASGAVANSHHVFSCLQA